MKKIISIALLVGGLVLLYFGYQEYHSMQSEINEFFTGSPSDRAIYLFAGGGAAVAAGLFGLLRRRS